MILVRAIGAAHAEPWLLQKHYAKRLCPISHAFGAFRGDDLIGVVTYGTPASAPLRAGVCGPDWSGHVLELNRLCCESSMNTASRLVGGSLRALPRPSVVVSFADTAQGHVGYIYQACNFLYTGLSAKRTDWKVRGRERMHGATIADESRGQEDRVGWMREKYGDAFFLSDRPRKHRYVYFCGDRRERKEMRSALRYSVEPFPKGPSSRYATVDTVDRQVPMAFGEVSK